MASKIAEEWVHALVPITNESGESGTGFLVTREDPNDPKMAKVAVVTNKHVVHLEAAKRAEMKNIYLGLNVKQADGSIVADTIPWPMKDNNGVSLWREHPDPDTDVLVVNITGLIAARQADFLIKWIKYDSFADTGKVAKHEISVGDDVVILGYPKGLRQGHTNLPLVRQGIISTQLGMPIVDEVDDGKGGTRERSRRGFLVDGGIIPGSSGSPVVLKPVIGREVAGKLVLGTPPALLLGIISGSHIAPIVTKKGTAPGFAGLGIAFDADTVRETMDLLF